MHDGQKGLDSSWKQSMEGAPKLASPPMDVASVPTLGQAAPAPNLDEVYALVGAGGNEGNGRGRNNRRRRHEGSDGGDEEGGSSAMFEFEHHVPRDLRKALQSGTISEETVLRYVELSGRPVMKILIRNVPFRNRALADPHMVNKIWAEQFLSISLVLSAEVLKRGDYFLKELEYVVANLVIGRFVNFALFFFMAPTLTLYATSPSSFDLKRYLSSLPAYVFQVSPKGRPPYTLSDRLASFLYKGTLYGAVGFGAGLVGVFVTRLLLWIKTVTDSSYESRLPPPPIFKTSLAWSAFMATHSNVRLQIVNGIEGVVYPAFRHRPLIPLATTWVLRLLNTYIGCSSWIDFVRFLGLQPKPGDSK